MNDTQHDKRISGDVLNKHKLPTSYLDYQALQSYSCSCKNDSAAGEDTRVNRLDTIQLLSAKEAGQILGINPNVVYSLWRKRLLDFWCIHGTKKTNLKAIIAFLEATCNQELHLDAENTGKE